MTAPAMKPKSTTRLGEECSPQHRKDLQERTELELQRQYPCNVSLWNTEQTTNTLVWSCSSPPQSREQIFPFLSRYLMTRRGKLKKLSFWLNQWILTVAVGINVQGATEHYVIENRLSLHGIDLSLVFYDSRVNLMWPNWLSLRTLYQAVISVV